jgi:hypothetical protein
MTDVPDTVGKQARDDLVTVPDGHHGQDYLRSVKESYPRGGCSFIRDKIFTPIRSSPRPRGLLPPITNFSDPTACLSPAGLTTACGPVTMTFVG